MKLTVLLFCLIIVAIIAPSVTELQAEPDAENLLIVRYHRFEKDYDEWQLWTWNQTTGQNNQPVAPTKKRDLFGLYFQIDLKAYGDLSELGILPRKGEWTDKDDPNRYWTPEMGREIWILEADHIIYTEAPDTSPPIAAAFVESANTVLITLAVPTTYDPEKPLEVSLTDEKGEEIPLKSVISLTKKTRQLLVETDGFDFTTALPVPDFQARVEGYKPVGLRFRGLLDHHYFSTDYEMGAIYTPAATTFRVFAPTATRVTLRLYQPAQGGDGEAIELGYKGHGLWSQAVKRDLKNWYYTYQVDGNDPRFNYDREMIDPYAKATTAHNGRGIIVHDETAIADRPNFPPEDAIICEMHIRDFSIDPESGIQMKGKYLGVTEEGTRLVGHDEITTGLDHLVELGINTVQIMPIHDFDNNEANEDEYGWGYMPMHFFSPDGWFATERHTAKRVTEFKMLVDALHRKGIKVIIDVVYNHTAEGNEFVQYSFNGIAPVYYYRWRDDGSMWNGSGCGNEFRSESPIGRKLIVDSIRYWLTEYKVDGFRFDLLGLIDLETILELTEAAHEIDPNTMIYGEPWTAGDTPITRTEKGSQRGRNFGVFNDDFRNALKGSPFALERTFGVDGVKIDDIKNGIRGSIHTFAHSPLEVINYAECHDNHTLWDRLFLLTENSKTVSKDDLVRIDKLIAATLFTAQGIPFIQLGQEFLRSKNLVENSYSSPDSINRVDWRLKAENLDVFKYYQGLITLRKAHPAFRLSNRHEIDTCLEFFDDDWQIEVPDQCVAFRLQHEPDEWDEIVVLLNAAAEAVNFTLPEGEWNIVVDDQQAGIEVITSGIAKKVEVAKRSAMVLYR